MAGASTLPTIYAAIRTDGVAGAGTASNPYNASTEAKFDAILASLLAKNGAQRTILKLGPGTYTVTPVRVNITSANPGGFVDNIPGNLEIIGASESTTIIRAGIVPTGNSTYWMFSQVGGSAGDYFENFTLDCNIQNQTVSTVTIDGIQYLHVTGTGTPLLASQVHVIDGGSRVGDPGNSEWFGINFGDVSGDEISQCRVDQYQGTGGCTALVSSNLITDNTVILNNNDPYGMAGHGGGGGFQDAFSPAVTVSGNTCSQCTWGVYSDVNNQTNANIENNVLNTLYGGVWLYSWGSNETATDLYVHNNTITKTYEAAVILGSAATTVVNSNLFVYDNTVTTKTSSTLTSDILVYLTAAKNSEVFGNTFSVSPGSDTSLPTFTALTDCDLSEIAWYDNTLSNGTVIPGPAGTVDHALSTVSTPEN